MHLGEIYHFHRSESCAFDLRNLTSPHPRGERPKLAHRELCNTTLLAESRYSRAPVPLWRVPLARALYFPEIREVGLSLDYTGSGGKFRSFCCNASAISSSPLADR